MRSSWSSSNGCDRWWRTRYCLSSEHTLSWSQFTEWDITDYHISPSHPKQVLIFDTIREATKPETQELVINLIYILGEYTSSDSLNLTVKLMDELHEVRFDMWKGEMWIEVMVHVVQVLELMVFERLSLIKLGITSVHDELPSEEVDYRQITYSLCSIQIDRNQYVWQSSFAQLFQSKIISYIDSIIQTTRGTDTSTDTRFLLILISALTKLASRWQAIASKVMLCLAKVMSREQFLDPAVAQRAGECITLLKDPRWSSCPSRSADGRDSVAAAVYDVPHTFGRRNGYTDENSSLPFILRPILPMKESRQLHDFLPWYSKINRVQIRFDLKE